MNFLGFSVFTLAVLTQATALGGKAKEKRGVADYQPTQYSSAPVYSKSVEAPSAIYSKQAQDYSKSPLTFYSNPAPPVYAKGGAGAGAASYSKSLSDLLAKSGPAIPQQPQEYQEYYQNQPVESASQAVNYVPQPQAAGLGGLSGGKIGQGGSQKFAYALQQQQSQPIYSSAADVSSFSYSSPVVAYNNQGLLHQIAGKGTSTRVAPGTYSSASTASKNQYQQYQPSPKVQYVSVPSAQQAYSAAQAGGNAYSSDSGSFAPSQNAYSASQAYSNPSANYEDASNAYQQISQKALFASSPEQPRAVTYQADSSLGQKVNYVQAPSPAVYQAKSAPVNYVSSAPQYSGQQYSNGLQQYSTAGHAGQGAAQPAYEAAQSAPEYIFSQHVPQSQLFSVNSQSKYGKPGVTYA